MIWESKYWKDDLLKSAKVLRRITTQTRWPEASFVLVEKTIMLGFYSIRKLLEAKKLSTSFASITIPARLYPSKGGTVTLLNWHHTYRFFDLENPQPAQLKVPDLANQVIHSFIFIPGGDPAGGLSTIQVASDRQKTKGLFEIPIDQVIHVFEIAGNDYPCKSCYKRDPKTGKEEVYQE
jgi:hypothetical protein